MEHSSEIKPAATEAVERKVSRTSDSDASNNEKGVVDPEVQQLKELAHDEEEVEGDRARRHELYAKYRPFILAALALVILGWWISSTVLTRTRHRWYVISPYSQILRSSLRIPPRSGSFRLFGHGSSFCEFRTYHHVTRPVLMSKSVLSHSDSFRIPLSLVLSRLSGFLLCKSRFLPSLGG